MARGREFLETTLRDAIAVAADEGLARSERDAAVSVLHTLAVHSADVDAVGATLAALVRAVAAGSLTAVPLSDLLATVSRVAAHAAPAAALREVLRSTFVEHQVLASMGLGATVRTGLRGYDEPTGGLRAGELAVVIADGSASTRLALRLVLGFLEHGTAPSSKVSPGCYIGAFARSPRQLGELLIADEGGVTPAALRRGVVSTDGWKRLTRAAARVGGARIWIDHDVQRSSLRSRFVRTRDAHPQVSLLLVDGLELLGAHACRRLVRLARELNVPVLATANRLDVPLDRQPEVVVRVAVDRAGRFEAVMVHDATVHRFRHPPAD